MLNHPFTKPLVHSISFTLFHQPLLQRLEIKKVQLFLIFRMKTWMRSLAVTTAPDSRDNYGICLKILMTRVPQRLIISILKNLLFPAN